MKPSRYIAIVYFVLNAVGFLAAKDWTEVLITVARPGPALQRTFHYDELEEFSLGLFRHGLGILAIIA